MTGSTLGCHGAGLEGAQAGAAPTLPVPAALQPPGLPGSPALAQRWAPHLPAPSAPPCSSTPSTNSSCSGAWKKSSWLTPEPWRLLLGGPPLDRPLSRLGPRTLQALTQPTVPPAPPLRPSVSWVASVAKQGTLAVWPMGCPGAGVQPCPALPMKAALVWGGSQMHLGVTWLALSPQGPGHGAGWTHSQTGNPHEFPRLGGPAAHLNPRCPGPGTPCTRSARGWSPIPGCDGPAPLPPGPPSLLFLFLCGLNPFASGNTPTPAPLGYQTSWDQTPYVAQWDLLYIPIGGCASLFNY